MSVITQLSVLTCFIITSGAGVNINQLNAHFMNYSDVSFGTSYKYSLYGIEVRKGCEIVAQATLVPEFETMSLKDILSIDKSQWHIFATIVSRRVNAIANIFVPANVYGKDINEARAYYIKDALERAVSHAYQHQYKYVDVPLKDVLFIMIDELIAKQQLVVMTMQDTKKRFKELSVKFED